MHRFAKKIMLINIQGAKCIGIDAVPVTIEVDIASGIGIHLVGLADVAVKESLLRTITALQSMGFRIPGRKIVINLAPADVHKKGSGYDVPISLGIIAASGQAEMPHLGEYLIMGELGLDGSVRDVPGSIPFVELAEKIGLKGCILPLNSALEAVDLGRGNIFGIETLGDALRILRNDKECNDLLVENRMRNHKEKIPRDKSLGNIMDSSEIIGQESAKRGIEIAAAGGHNVLLIGAPGSGKSSLAKAMSAILPPMTFEESIQTSKIYSVALKHTFNTGLIRQRPFRSPHNSISVPALIGGGTENPTPGEISLAHNGILFIDEFCEAPKRLLEALRSPMEDKRVVISRIKSKVEYPADFTLIAAANPCPCGYYGEGDRCTCTPARRDAYFSKLSGPILDRIDIQLWMHPVDARRLVQREKGESSSAIAQRVARAREIQKMRFDGEGIFCNAAMSNRMLDKYCQLSPECNQLLEKLIARMGLSARACSRIVKLARTIADLEGVADILPEHITEAAGYRFLDRKNTQR